MKFTDIFIRRPVLALVVNLVIIIAGLQAIRALNVRQYPRSENSVVTVTTVYVGASAELIRGFITTPLERAIAAADGIVLGADATGKAKMLLQTIGVNFLIVHYAYLGVSFHEIGTILLVLAAVVWLMARPAQLAALAPSADRGESRGAGLQACPGTAPVDRQRTSLRALLAQALQSPRTSLGQSLPGHSPWGSRALQIWSSGRRDGTERPERRCGQGFFS